MPKDGEILIRKIKGRESSNEFGFAVQLIEADHLDEKYNKELPNGNKIRMSIEHNKWNRPIAYHVLTRHPGDNIYTTSKSELKRERIPAEDIIHLYFSERPSQSRGLPWMLSAMTRLNMLGGYEDAEITAARAAACKMGFYKTPDGASYTGDDQSDKQLLSQFESGVFEELPEGTDFIPFDPQHPNSAYGIFIKTALRGAAAGLGVGYNSLANDLEGVNFSSIRQGVLEERDLWKVLQTWIIEHVCDDIFSDWLLWSLTTQKIPLPLTKISKFNKPIWRPRGWSWVDPLKEVKSNIEAINAGLKSAQDVASEQGKDIEEVYQALQTETKLREKYGITLGQIDANPIIEVGQNEG